MSYVKLEDVKNAFPFLEKHKMYVLEKWWIDKMLDFEVPKADVVEVKHGHWVMSNGDYEWECSACGEGLTDNRTAYCPTCGAKMDEMPNVPRQDGKSTMELERIMNEAEE